MTAYKEKYKLEGEKKSHDTERLQNSVVFSFDMLIVGCCIVIDSKTGGSE